MEGYAAGWKDQISIHALRKESDTARLPLTHSGLLFQSTLSVRRATSVHRIKSDIIPFQSTLSVRRATKQRERVRKGLQFQSTLSVRRATPMIYCSFSSMALFQSTLSVRRATQADHRPSKPNPISIHALRKESDMAVREKRAVRRCISIHALRKESDRTHADGSQTLAHFNPRSP